MQLPSYDEARGFVYAKAYKSRGTPRIKLGGLSGDVGELYDGSMIAAATEWWNEFLTRRPGLERLGSLRRFDSDLTRRLAESVNPANRDLLIAVGSLYAPAAERLGSAAVALAYAFARTMTAGTKWASGDDVLFELAATITPETLGQYAHRYGIVADYYSDFPSSGWWSEREEGWYVYPLTIAAIRCAYRDQVKRWEKAVGVTLGKGAGWTPGEEGGLTREFRDLLFEQGGRFFEAEVAEAE